MKTPLPPALQSALAEVAAIADGLAETACDFPSAKFGDMNIAGVLDNLDHVASCLTLAELEHAPAMLNAAARAFRQTFPGLSDGFAAAGRLQSIAYAIELEQTAAAADPVIRAAIDAAFAVIQSAHDPENRFDSGTAGELYAERFEQFRQLAAALAHFSEWEANRVAAFAANQTPSA